MTMVQYTGSIADELEAALTHVVENASHWSHVCDLVARQFSAVGTIILSTQPHQNGPWLTQSAALVPTTEAYVTEGWNKIDMRMQLVRLLHDGHIITEEDFGSREALVNKPFYRDFLIPHGLGYFACGLLAIEKQTFGFSIQFPFDRRPFSPEERDRLQAICTRTEQAMRLASVHAVKKINDYRTLMNESAAHVFVLDPQGKLVQTGDQDDPPHCNHILSQLSDAEREHLTGVCESPVEQRKSMSVEFELDAKRMQLLAFQLPVSLRHFFFPHKVICLVREATDREHLLRNWLRDSHDLTPAEVETAMFMTKGLQPAEIAELRGLAVGTISQRVKAIYAKMGIGNQLKLVAKLNDKFR